MKSQCETISPSQIEKIALDRQNELLREHFGKLTEEAVHQRPETIGNYTPDLPSKIEAEFKEFLEKLWVEFCKNSEECPPLVLEEQKLRQLLTERDRQLVEEYHKKAEEITLWEKITRSNHKDVARYKELLRDYTENLLTIMRLDFLEEITGRHILGKTFED